MNYWQNRAFKAQEKITNKSEQQIRNQLRKYYGNATKNVIDSFEGTLDKLRANMADGREPTPADLYKLDKYWQAQAQMRQELQKLGDKQISLLSKHFELDYFDIYYSINLPDTTTFSTIDKKAVNQMINSIWCADGKSWSQRVWENTDKLLDTLNEGLIHTVATGKKTTELKNILQERFNVSYSRANTLVRTELAHIQTEAAKQRYKDYGLEEYEILGNDDDTCGNHSVDCHKMDGKKFNYNEMVIGKNAPPFHPNCRCCIVPVVK